MAGRPCAGHDFTGRQEGEEKGRNVVGRVFAAPDALLLLFGERQVVVSDGHANILDLVVVKPALKVYCLFRLVMDDGPVRQHQRERAVRLQELADFGGVIFKSCKIRFSERHKLI